MGQRRLVVQADLLVQICTEGVQLGALAVDNPLPSDVAIVRYQQQPSRYGSMSSSVLWVVLESPSWEGDQLGAGQELEPIAFTVDSVPAEAEEVSGALQAVMVGESDNPDNPSESDNPPSALTGQTGPRGARIAARVTSK